MRAFRLPMAFVCGMCGYAIIFAVALKAGLGFFAAVVLCFAVAILWGLERALLDKSGREATR